MGKLMHVYMKTSYSIHRISSPFPPFSITSKLLVTVTEFMKKRQCGSALTSPKSRPKLLFKLNDCHRGQHHSHVRGVENLLPTCQHSIGSLCNGWCYCRNWICRYELRTARKHIRGSIRVETLGNRVRMCLSLWSIETEKCVHRGIIPLDPTLYEDSLGLKQRSDLTRPGTQRHPCFQTATRL